jgi:ribosomal 50S subunit-associated protein YjgA (DUF615 family)
MKPSGHRQVEEFMHRLEHPLKKDIEAGKEALAQVVRDWIEATN